MISQDDYDRIVDLNGTLQQTLNEIEGMLKEADSSLYDQWKTYGKHVTNEFHIMGPTLEECIEKLEEEVGEEEEV